ncbi:hypothetical protein [Blastococcus deserti]|uniref:Uncharacterized protein n=1 Tax=Blastococcus deserti TaxID=2259033 RepID=A0ABW4X6T3_9ACTN
MQVVEQVEAPPSAAIESFLDDLTAQVAEDPDSRSGDPWAGSPWDDAVGDVAVLSLREDRAGAVLAVCGRLAAAHGLVCYDPQAGTLVR